MKYFGTDGIRGVYGVDIDEKLAYEVGLALCAYFGQGEYVVARDTRPSGESLITALGKGLYDGGARVLMVGIMPTPAVSYFVKSRNAVCGVVISASHNPAEYNGIKVFTKGGVKICQNEESGIEALIGKTAKSGFGRYECLAFPEKEYVNHLVLGLDADLTGLKVCLDCGYGATYAVAKQAFSKMGATIISYCDKPYGERINAGVGALYPSFIAEKCADNQSLLGFAFDGDGDRVSVVYGGEEVDGDSVLYNLALALKIDDGVVGTTLSNSGLDKALKSVGVSLIRADVGDKYVSELMRKEGYRLGGEQSGHFVISPYSQTGDGILTALILSAHLYGKGALSKPMRITALPQITRSFPMPSDKVRGELNSVIEQAKARLGSEGRLIVRPSGTEPKLRVTVESPDGQGLEEIIEVFSKVLQ